MKPAGATPFIRSYRPGQTICETGESSRRVFHIQTGWVRLQVTSADGVRTIIAFLGPGETLGALQGESVVSAECVTAVTVVAYDAADLAVLSETSPVLADWLHSTEARRLADLTDHVQDLRQRTAPQRALCLLAWVFVRVRPDGVTGLARLPMSREDMADYLDVAPATLSRIMSQFQDEGRVRLDGPRNFAILARPPFLKNCHAEKRCGACAQLRREPGAPIARPAMGFAAAL